MLIFLKIAKKLKIILTVCFRVKNVHICHAYIQYIKGVELVNSTYSIAGIDIYILLELTADS
jgi:hypothetical protein